MGISEPLFLGEKAAALIVYGLEVRPRGWRVDPLDRLGERIPPGGAILVLSVFGSPSTKLMLPVRQASRFELLRYRFVLLIDQFGIQMAQEHLIITAATTREAQLFGQWIFVFVRQPRAAPPV